MSLNRQHEIHGRRFGRNLGVGLVLGALIAIIFGLTVVKIERGDFQVQPQTQGVSNGN
ncbi:hypothetical protein [Thetidibacter halocola]|uniref:Cytochrome C oxidase assembly protein n=1 Tax=Thetidibacter halocola TaxID=2827239 RepID=A0A8J8BA89_9RHOB|nr:hypothetical protein [Thetidibacter halocola]MBS0126664.1 hypothetical protein [Thetidibacter halocola]